MHPDAEPEHHHAGEQRGEALHQLALGTADIDHIGGQRPGGEAGDEGQPPADVHATHGTFLPGIAQEGEDGGKHQDCLYPFAQQDQQGGNETDGETQRVAAKLLGGLRQLALGQLQLLRHLSFREAIAQRLAVGHQLLLGGAAQIGVDVVQRAFHQLEAFQVGRHRQVVGLVAVAFAIDREALVQGGGGIVDQLPRTALLQRRMRTQGAEALRSGLAVVLGDFGRSLRGQGRQRVGMGLVRLRTAGAQAGHIAGQVPALAFVELVGERRHVGAGHAQADDVTQVVEAQVVEALAIGEVRWRRFQADAGGAVALARIAMADRALLGIDRRRAARVGGDRGGLHHLVDIRHPCLEVARLEGHVPSRQALLDGLAQAGDAPLQLGALGAHRQGQDQCLQVADELHLFLVFAGVDDLAVSHGRRIVGRQVTQQMQGLGGVDGRVG
ncbi:Uncharacterised protein [Pseudomonas aeruginosa]|nr:Uncharacterised protein [Pseudomonas aeruginosa]